MHQSKKSATFIGSLALIFWAFSPVLATAVKNIPIFEILSICLGFSFIATAAILTLKKRWSSLRKQPLTLWVCGILGIFFTDLLYFEAFKHAPSAHVDLINYLWPILVIFFASFLPNESIKLKHVIAALFGFAGTFWIITDGNSHLGLQQEYVAGYIYVFIGAIFWSVYSVIAKKYNQSPIEMIGMYCGIGMLLSIIAHMQFEVNVMPTFIQWFVLIFIGLTTQGASYYFWGHGVRQGNIKLLSILSYANPILSIALLIVFGMTEPTSTLFVASILVTLAGIIASVNWQKLYSQIRNISLLEQQQKSI